MTVRLCGDTSGVDDERPPICPTCGVTMLPAELSARDTPGCDWVCIECEEIDGPDAAVERPNSNACRSHP
jgi:hypothetical protein